MHMFEENIKQLGIEIPDMPSPLANYVPYKVSDSIVYISGQGPVKNGKLVYKGNCKNGYIHGQYTGYYENGQLKEEGRLKKGYREGEWSLYSDQGELVKKELHKNKTLITTEYF